MARVVDRDGRRAFALRLTIIAVAAFVVRLVYILTIARHDPNGFGDPLYYHVQANLLAHGHGFSEPFTWLQSHQLVPTAVHPPLYTVALASSSVLGFTSFFAHKVVSCLIGTATVVVVGLLGRDIAGPRVGLIAAIVALAYPNLWVVDGLLLPEGLFALLVALSLLAAVRFLRAPRFTTAALLGIAIALATLTRGEGIFLTVLLALPVAALARDLTLRERAVRLGVMALAVVVALAPWIVRNTERFQGSVFLSTNSGDVLAQSNCDATYHGTDLGFWSFPCGEINVHGDASVRSAAQRKKALRYIRAHEGRVPVVVAARLGRVWGVFRPAQGAHLDTVEGRNLHVAQAGLGAYWFLLPFAIAGAVLLGRDRRRRALLLILLAPVVMVTITAATTYGTTRFRVGAEVSIVVLAAVAAGAAWRSLRARAGARRETDAEPDLDERVAGASPVAPAPPTISHP